MSALGTGLPKFGAASRQLSGRTVAVALTHSGRQRVSRNEHPHAALAGFSPSGRMRWLWPLQRGYQHRRGNQSDGDHSQHKHDNTEERIVPIGDSCWRGLLLDVTFFGVGRGLPNIVTSPVRYRIQSLLGDRSLIAVQRC